MQSFLNIHFSHSVKLLNMSTINPPGLIFIGNVKKKSRRVLEKGKRKYMYASFNRNFPLGLLELFDFGLTCKLTHLS